MAELVRLDDEKQALESQLATITKNIQGHLLNDETKHHMVGIRANILQRLDAIEEILDTDPDDMGLRTIPSNRRIAYGGKRRRRKTCNTRRSRNTRNTRRSRNTRNTRNTRRSRK
jgi:hypothetical protein